MVEKFSVHITPFDLERTVQVYLPDDWQTSRQKYPVLYMFDGHNLFFDQDATYGKSWGLKEFLDGWDKKIILVGVECNKEGDGRLREYCPYRQRGWLSPDFEGRGQEYTEWLCGELKPLIDKKYPTLPGRSNTGIAGSSMGGLMSIYGVAAYNDVFSKAACLSSVIRLCRRQLLGSIQNIHPDTRVYLSWGTEETKKVGKFSPTAIANREIAEAFWKQGAMATIFCQEGGRHCEADWEKQVPGFMEYLWF